jgi:diguanylate cyclase (GGDEF)-like protein
MGERDLGGWAIRTSPMQLNGAPVRRHAPEPGVPMPVAHVTVPGTGPAPLNTGEDWHALLDAAKERLRGAAAWVPAEPAAHEAPHPPGRVSTVEPHPLRAAALDCVMVLEQLQHRLDEELARRQRSADHARHLHDVLNRLRLELAGAKVGELHARYQSLHDELTGLPNRVHFRRRLDQALALLHRASRPLGLLYLDLDGFKPVNDAYGHGAGDELLRIVAARLRHALRANDLVGRIGGDEFACLLPDVTGRPHLGRIARKLLDGVAAPVKIGRVRVSVPPSIGIALCPDDGVSADDLLCNADAAMYRAKRQRLGVAFFGHPGGR